MCCSMSGVLRSSRSKVSLPHALAKSLAAAANPASILRKFVKASSICEGEIWRPL